MTIDPLAKLRHLLQVLAFCLAIATIQYAFLPECGYGVQLVYSLCIGLITWACIDFPRHWLPSSAETGWPQGLAGVALVVVAIAIGYFAGTALGDGLCRTLELYTGPRPDPVVLARQSVLITALAGIAGSYYFFSAARRSHLERRMSEVQRHADEARLKLLETQLEPHMRVQHAGQSARADRAGPVARAADAGPHDRLPACDAGCLARHHASPASGV